MRVASRCCCALRLVVGCGASLRVVVARLCAVHGYDCRWRGVVVGDRVGLGCWCRHGRLRLCCGWVAAAVDDVVRRVVCCVLHARCCGVVRSCCVVAVVC